MQESHSRLASVMEPCPIHCRGAHGHLDSVMSCPCSEPLTASEYPQDHMETRLEAEGLFPLGPRLCSWSRCLSLLLSSPPQHKSHPAAPYPLNTPQWPSHY